MRSRLLFVATALAVLLTVPARARGGDASPLTEADQRAFAWFDGIGLPSTAGKPYVRVTWTNAAAGEDAPRDERVWEVDGFLIDEKDGTMTLLDADGWPRRVERRGLGAWSGRVDELDLARVAAEVSARLRAFAEDPASVEPARVVFRGVRGLVGTASQSLLFARHVAEHHLDAAAHEILEAARALPATDPSTTAPAPIEETARRQMADAVIWRIVFDFAERDVSRARLLERYRGWQRSFPKSEHQERVAAAIRVLEPMVKEDATHPGISDEALGTLSPDLQAREWVFRLRDQGGDVSVGRAGVRLEPDEDDTPLDHLVSLGLVAAPALVDALTDARFTRAVLFRFDADFARQHVARVGDMAEVALERITHQRNWEPTADAPSMFDAGAAEGVQERWRAWLARATDLTAALVALAAEKDPARRVEMARALPDRGAGPLGGAPRAVWGTSSFTRAVPGLDDAAAKDLLEVVLANAPSPRMQTLAAWALLDLGDEHAVEAVIDIWNGLDDEERADPEQGGTVASFLAACNDPSAVSALANGLDARPPAVREIAVLAFLGEGLGAVRGFSADPPAGWRTDWALEGAAADAAEDLLGARLADLDVEPLGRIPRQTPLADFDPSFDAGRRIADVAIRVLGAHWSSVYPLESAPVRTADEWETLRTRFEKAWHDAAARRAPR